MRSVVQRVKKSSVSIDGQIYSSINEGLLILLGISNNDTEKDIEYISEKILNLRIFSDENYKMNKNILDIEDEIIIVSQFTLYGDARKGRRPSYDLAAGGNIAEPIYNNFIKTIKSKYNGNKIFTGSFGAMMEVEIINDGPVTILLDSERNF